MEANGANDSLEKERSNGQDKNRNQDDVLQISLKTATDDLPDDDPDVDRLDEEGGWGWMVILGAFFVFLFVPGMIRSYGVVHLEILDTFHGCTEEQASWIPAFLTSIAIGLAPISGVLCKMYTCRNVVFVGGLLCCFGLSLSFFATSIYHLYITIGLITGIGAGLTTTPSMIAVNSNFVKKRGLVSGIALSGTAVGSFVIPMVVKNLVSVYTFRGAMLLMGAMIANICACSLLYTPDGRWVTASTSAMATDQSAIHPRTSTIFKDQKKQKPLLIKSADLMIHRHNHHGPPIAVRRRSSLVHVNDVSSASVYCDNRHLKSPKDKRFKGLMRTTLDFLASCLDFSLFRSASYTLSVVCAVCAAFAYPHVLVYVPAYATTLGFTKRDAGLLLSISSVVDLFGRIPYGYLADRPCVKRSHALALSCFVSAAGTLCLPLSSSYFVLVACTAAFSFGIGTIFMLLPVILADNHGVELLPSTYGLMRLFQGLAIFIMPPIAGAIKDSTGYYQPCFFLMGTILLGGVIAMLFMPCAQRYDTRRLSEAETSTTDSTCVCGINQLPEA